VAFGLEQSFIHDLIRYKQALEFLSVPLARVEVL